MPRQARLSRPLRAVLIGALGILLLLPGAAVASIQHPTVVSDNPANVTPNLVGDGTAVYAFNQIGSTMYAGGNFATVSNAARTTTYSRSNIMAFNATTGALTSFAPSFNGAVWALVSSGSSLYVGGYFTTVNGVARRGLVKIDAATGAVDTAFNANFGSGHVQELRLVNGRLIVGGSFPGKLVALNPTNGANTGYINAAISGSVASNAGATDVYRFAVNPAGTRLVAVGNFTSVAGQARSRAFMLNLDTASTSLSTWYYQPLTRMCRANSLPAYLRDVDFSPDGSYFVFAATGYIPLAGGVGTDICDAAARFNTDVLNPTLPVWINYTGGDTLHSVAVTGAAVYIQGHQRWADNPQGNNSAGPGAVARQGIAAINPTTGLALPWNPGKTRAVGGKDLYVTSAGLWVGSDGTRFAGEYRKGIAFCPLPSAAAVAKGTFAVLKAGKIKGKVKVGKKLKVASAVISPAATTVTYSWLRNGKAIKKATKRTYKLKKADAGKRISVKVVYVRAGWTTRAEKLAPVRKVRGRAT